MPFDRIDTQGHAFHVRVVLREELYVLFRRDDDRIEFMEVLSERFGEFAGFPNGDDGRVLAFVPPASMTRGRRPADSVSAFRASACEIFEIKFDGVRGLDLIRRIDCEWTDPKIVEDVDASGLEGRGEQATVPQGNQAMRLMPQA
jgi:hypothetical protein